MLLYRTVVRASVGLLITISIAVAFGLVLILQSKSLIYSYAVKQTNSTETTIPFPVGVDKERKIITEIAEVENFFSDSLAYAPNSRNNWWNKVATFFADDTWYQNLASPVGRIVVIWPGNRKEEVVKHVGDILRWSDKDREMFLTLMDDTVPNLYEGFYLPGQYVSHRYATPEDIHKLLTASFEREVLNRYTPEVRAKVPFADALIIASLIEREASDFENMREVSGVIWNRLFIDMPLQLDATLQYIKANDPYQPAWWPAVRPPDKFLTSPYNTYQHAGLPPGPIANPSIEAILAALNPIQTDCLFYFHTRNGAYHCSPTYEEHVSKLRALYGRGS